MGEVYFITKGGTLQIRYGGVNAIGILNRKLHINLDMTTPHILCYSIEDIGLYIELELLKV